MENPKELHYTKDHEWIRIEGETAYIGITHYAQCELGEIIYVDITTEGETLDAEAVFGSIEAVKTVSDLMMPMAGKVLEINAELDARPELVNKDPYGEGWLIKIKLQKPEATADLLDSAAYEQWIGKA